MSEQKIIESIMKEKAALTDVIKSMDEQLNAYNALGTPTEISEALDKATALIESLGDLKIDQIKENADKLVKFETLGTPETIEEALDVATSALYAYKEIGSPLEINTAIDKAVDILKQYQELGTPEEVKKALDAFENNIIIAKSESLATAYNVETELVESMFHKVNDFAVVEELLEQSLSIRKKDDTKEVNEEEQTEPAVEKINEGEPAADKKDDRLVGVDESMIRRVARGLM